MKFGMHNEKYSRMASGGIMKEQMRQYKHNEYANDVDTDKSHLNQYDGNLKWDSVFKDAISVTESTIGKKVRKDTVILNSIVEAVPKSWSRGKVLEYFKKQDDMIHQLLQEKGIEDKWHLSSIIHFDETTPHRTFTFVPVKEEYFKKQDDMIHQLLQEKGIEDKWHLSSIIHFDETTPHRTFTFVPVKDGKLQNKNIVNKSFLAELQKRGWSVYQDFAMDNPSLEKMDIYENGSKAEHKHELQYKLDKLKEDIKAQESILRHLNEQINEFKHTYSELPQITQIQPVNGLFGQIKGVSVEDIKKLKNEAINGYNLYKQVADLTKKTEELKSKLMDNRIEIMDLEQEKNHLYYENQSLLNSIAELQNKYDDYTFFVNTALKEIDPTEAKKMVNVFNTLKQERAMQNQNDIGYEL